MHTIQRKASYALAALLCVASLASAHPGHRTPAGGFASGAAHPIAGIDHVLAMVAVGLLAARLGGRALWMLPAAFVPLMIGGGLLAGAGVAVPAVEQGIAASVFAFGCLLAVAMRLPTLPLAGLVGAFAIFHGYAHVAESTGGSPASYLGGFALSTTLLHAAGIAIAMVAMRLIRNPANVTTFARVAGMAIAACGLLLLAGVL